MNGNEYSNMAVKGGIFKSCYDICGSGTCGLSLDFDNATKNLLSSWSHFCGVISCWSFYQATAKCLLLINF